MFQIDAVSSVPIYRQVLEQLRRLISSGQLSPGDALPSVRELATQHAVNPMTISKAYGLAEVEGLLLRQRGRPMMVAEQKKINKADRLNELDGLIDSLIDASLQLSLQQEDVVSYLEQKWNQE